MFDFSRSFTWTMLGTTAVFSVMDQTSLLNYTSVSDFTYLCSYKKFVYLPCNSSFKVANYRNNLVLFRNTKDKLDSRFIAYCIPTDGTDRHRSTEDPVYICQEDDGNSMNPGSDEAVIPTIEGNSEKTQKDSLVQLSDIQPTVVGQGNHDCLLDKMKAIQLNILAMEQWNSSRLKMCHGYYSSSATNLIHFLALTSLDIEHTKEELSSIGLLNLENISSNVLSSIFACIQMLMCTTSDYMLSTEDSGEGFPINNSLGYPKEDLARIAMMQRASSNRDRLLGTLQGHRMAHIMVTVGEEAVDNDTHVVDLINAGTTIFRINCAHGNSDIWGKIISRVKRNSQHLEKPCRILMDLAGPKLRTGKLKAGPCVTKISPKRNSIGRILQPAHVWLSPQGSDPPPPHVSPDVILQVDGKEFLSRLEIDDSVSFTDARGKRITLKILSKCPIFSGVGFMAACSKTAYVESGTVLSVKEKRRKSSMALVVEVPPTEQYVRLRIGDLLTVYRDASDKQEALTCSKAGTHKISCPSSYLFDSVKPGDRISFDDGKIWGIVKGSSGSEVIVSITHAGLNGTKLGSEKSINIPDSDIRYEGLTSKDLVDLDFVAGHADMVGISFIRDVNDVVLLHQELAKRKISNLGIVFKIETQSGFEKLPLIILEAMKCPNPLGVMIARGDLAVECGWEKIGDIQNEILSICSAAHVPVILATQVLESLVKLGVPSRAEMTDAVYGRRASCVMLNKGKHVLEAVTTLEIILNSKCTKVKPELKPLVLSSNVNKL